MTQEEFVDLCAEGSYDQICEAIRSGFDPNNPEIIKGNHTPAMFIAASAENTDAVKALAEHGADCSDGFVAAVVGNHMDMAKLLVECGGDINAQDSKGSTPLLTSVTMNRPDILEQLIALGADVNVKSSGGNNALAFAAMMAARLADKDSILPKELNPEIIRLLVQNGAEYLDAMMIAIRTECDDFARIALDAGADPNISDDNGRSLVMYSVMTGGMLLRTLLEHGAKPDTPDNKGRTPLMIAAIDEEAEPEVMDTLLEFGADINARDNRGITPLMWAAVNADKEPNALIPALIRTGGFMAEGWKLWSAFLCLAAAAKREIQLDTIRRLIQRGADVNAVDNRGMNAIMYSLMNGDDEAADILADAGAQINFDMKQ